MDVKQAIDVRRAYRSLSPTEVSADLIRELASAAQLAASCFNKQPWRFVFVSDPSVLSRLCDALAKGNEWARKASMMIAVFTEKELDCIYRGREYFLFDTGMGVAHLVLRATELGYVAHPIAGFDGSAVKELLGIPADMLVITLIIFGEHNDGIDPDLSDSQAEIEKERPERLPLREFAFHNRYGSPVG